MNVRPQILFRGNISQLVLEIWFEQSLKAVEKPKLRLKLISRGKITQFPIINETQWHFCSYHFPFSLRIFLHPRGRSCIISTARLRERERENQTTFTTARSQIGFHDHQLIDYDAQIPCTKFYPICSMYTRVMKGSKIGKWANFMTYAMEKEGLGCENRKNLFFPIDKNGWKFL